MGKGGQASNHQVCLQQFQRAESKIVEESKSRKSQLEAVSDFYMYGMGGSNLDQKYSIFFVLQAAMRGDPGVEMSHNSETELYGFSSTHYVAPACCCGLPKSPHSCDIFSSFEKPLKFYAPDCCAYLNGAFFPCQI